MKHLKIIYTSEDWDKWMFLSAKTLCVLTTLLSVGFPVFLVEEEQRLGEDHCPWKPVLYAQGPSAAHYSQ